MFWIPIPGKQSEVDQIAKEWVELHKKKNAPRGYQTFKCVFGMDPGYMIVYWGKDELDFASKSKKNGEVMGEESEKLWARTLAVTQKIYHKTGWFRPDLSYTYTPVVVK
jgi:hypothetical protein